jgi:hypothetical protein
MTFSRQQKICRKRRFQRLSDGCRQIAAPFKFRMQSQDGAKVIKNSKDVQRFCSIVSKIRKAVKNE